MNGTFIDQDWMTNFRMSQSMFDYICQKLEREIAKNDTSAYPYGTPGSSFGFFFNGMSSVRK